MINARNDPFLPAHALRGARAKGGRRAGARISAQRRACGFLCGPFPGRHNWLPQRLFGFFDTVNVPAEIFRAYDIRGIVGKTLTPAIVRDIGRALGSVRARARRADLRGRPRRPAVRPGAGRRADADGLNAAGADVIDIGMGPTPVAYFAAHHLGCGSCVAVTGSHNPPDYNGLKIVVGGDTLYGDEIQELRNASSRASSRPGRGQAQQGRRAAMPTSSASRAT